MMTNDMKTHRCEGGEELETIMASAFSSAPPALSSGPRAASPSEWDADALAGLYKVAISCNCLYCAS